MEDNTTQMLVLIGALVVVALAVITLMRARATRHRHDDLKQRFGPEYDREVERQGGNVARAEHELAGREQRVRAQHVRQLPEVERVKFASDWSNLQTRFVDDPAGAVESADELIQSVMLARGYSSDNFDQRVADLSVEHSGVVQHYRAARVLADANREGRANTEELRQAVVHYRALFAELLAEPRAAERQMQEARA
jgi:hypothetical protein